MPAPRNKLRRLLAPAVALATGSFLGISASSALAAYPGVNGQIAMELNGDIQRVDPAADPLVLKNVTKSGNVGEEHPTISPNGKLVVYSRGDGRGIFYEKLNGKSERPKNATARFKDYFSGVGDPTWSPDQTKIAFYCWVTVGGGEICRVNADGTGFKFLTACSCVMFNGGVEWSVDNRILFHTGGNGVWTMDPSGGTLLQVINNSTAADSNWHPSGDSFAYNDDVGDIETRNADGSGEQLIYDAFSGGSTPPGLNNPAYSPDGSLLAVLSDYDLHILDPVSDTTTPITSPLNTVYDPDWGPKPPPAP